MLLLTDAATRVPHLDETTTILSPDVHLDVALVSEPETVRNEHHQHLGQPILISLNGLVTLESQIVSEPPVLSLSGEQFFDLQLHD